MATLYRKYRPKNFQETVGQNPIKITIESQIQADDFSHAYLFCGPRAVGKTTLARVFAKAVNCLNRKKGESEPCNKCEACQEINLNRSLDVIEIDAASHTGVDNVRENIIATSRIAPSNRKYKIFIIDEVHMLSISAFNALLKVLEEPPVNVVFILCTTEVHKIPLTIISRCQRFDFKRISVKDIADKLTYIVEKEGVKVERKILESIARRSDGHMRDAESLLGQIIAIAGKEITQKEADLVIPRSDIQEILNLLDLINRKDVNSGIALVNKLVDDGVDLKTFITDFIEISRRIMISKINPRLAEKIGMELGETLDIKINELTGKIDLEKLVKILEKFMVVKNSLKTSFIIQLPVELALIDLCQEKTINNPEYAAVKKNAEKEVINNQEQSSKQEKPIQNTEVSGELGKQEICSRWHEVLAKVKKHNHSLSFILKVCQVKEVKNNAINLAFRHKFHKDRLSENRIKELVEKTLTEVFGKNLTISALVDENLETKNNESSQEKDDLDNHDKSIDNILKTFGGKIIE